MSNRERRKGRDGEAEVRRLLSDHQLYSEPLGGRVDQADQLLVSGVKVRMALEVKRQETARVWAWWEQATTNAHGMTPAVAFRRSRSEWLVVMRLEDLAELIR